LQRIKKLFISHYQAFDMFIAQEKKKNNIAEYILYMWHVEDLLRAFKLDIQLIKDHVITPLQYSEEQTKKIIRWYDGLIEMIKEEGIEENGHLLFIKNTLSDLTDLHISIMRQDTETAYQQQYFYALPYIKELISKSGANPETADTLSEIESSFEGLYGLWMMRLKKKEITTQTEEAFKYISSFIANLTHKYHETENGRREFYTG